MKTYIQVAVLFFIVIIPAVVFSGDVPDMILSMVKVEKPLKGDLLKTENESFEADDSDTGKDSFLQEEESEIPEEKQEDIHILKEFTEHKSDPFYLPDELKVNVKFWENIYSKYSTNEVIIHDSTHLDIIFEVIKIADQPDSDGKAYYSGVVREKIKNEKARYSNLLLSIHQKIKEENELTDEESKIVKLYTHVSGENKYLKASENIRSQLGLKERFIDGLKRSGMYIEKIKNIFKEYGLPDELTVLPHVESSFNYSAYSSAGAAGIWQFMRPTGRLFMRIDYAVDERRDPIASTVAAAKLLKRNYEQLGNWPMAIIAYNHGLSGMKRAKKLLGKDVVDVINNYKSRLFGFASRNFYAEFLAALKITKNTKAYFGEVELNKAFLFDTIEIKKYVSVETLSRHLKLTKKEIETFNPALRPPVFAGKKLVPAGYMLHVPKQDKNKLEPLYESIPQVEQEKTQILSALYRINKGDNLFVIAKKFKTNVNELMALNDIQNPKRITAGQTLKLPNEKDIKQTKLKEEKNGDPKQVNIAEKSVPVKISKEVDKKLLKPEGLFSPAKAHAGNPGYGRIRVAEEETLGHYSDWSNSSTDQIRKLNRMKKRQQLVIGGDIKIPLSQITLKEFESKRAEHILAIQEDFFSSYKVENTETLKIGKGKTPWKICMDNDIPFWLLKRYNSEKNLARIKPGDTLTIPVIVKATN